MNDGESAKLYYTQNSCAWDELVYVAGISCVWPFTMIKGGV